MSVFGSMSSRSTNKFNKIITYLSQKVIDVETDNREIFDSGENNLPENIDTFDITQERDLGVRSTLKIANNIYRMVEGADNTSLRCWVKFSNAAKLYDYSKNNLQSFVYGLGQIPILNMKKVSDNVLGYEFESFFNGNDQYAYTDDHEKIRVSEMFADATVSHISFFDRFTPVSIGTQIGRETSVLFEKIDDDQLKDGFAATMNKKGDLFFYIRRDFKQYSSFLKGVYYDQLQEELTNAGDYSATNYHDENYLTDKQYVSNLICSTEKTDDHWFVYDKTTHAIKYILNGIEYVPQTLSVSPVLDVPFQDGAYNTDGTDRVQIHDVSGNNFNGTLENPQNGQWQTNNTFFSFGGNTAGNGGGCDVDFPTIAALDSANEYTISLMLKPDSIVNTKSYSEWIISKNYAVNGSFILYRVANSGTLRAEFKDASGWYGINVADAFENTDWHSIVIKFKSGEAIDLVINGVSHLGTTLPANLNTGGPLKLFHNNAAFRGQISLLKVFTTKLGSTDTQLIIDEGYHNPTFPKAEKPQPEPVENPPPITNPFEVFYNLATQQPTIDIANTVWLNNIAGDSAFVEFYNVVAGVDESFPLEVFYDVADGQSSGSSDPFTEQYNLQSTENSSVQLDDDQNDAGGVGIQAGSQVIGKKITRAIFYLRSENSPIGSVYCRIWDANDNLVVTLQHWNGSTLGTLDAATVATSYTAYEFRNTTHNWGSTSVQAGWTIGIEYVTTDENDRIHVRRRASAVSTEIQHSRDVGTSDFNTNSSFDVAAILYSGGGTTASTPYLEIKNATFDDEVDQYYGIGEYFPANSPALTKKPTKAEFKAYRHASANGTLYLNHYGPDTTLKATLATFPVSGITTSPPTGYNITWNNINYDKPIEAGDRILLVLSGNNSNPVYVLTNQGATGSPSSYDGTRTVLTRRRIGFGGFVPEAWVQTNTLDISGKIYIGGNEFDSDLSFTASKTRIYIKAAGASSSLVGKKMTQAIIPAQKFGAPQGLITCNVRKNSDNSVRFTLGTVDASTLDPDSFEDITFTNVFNTETIQLNDRVCFEYLGADGTNYVTLKVNKDVYQTLNTIGGWYESPSNMDNAQIDLAAKLYTGGEPDLASRTRVGQKIVVDDDSILDGNKLTKIGVWLINPDGVLGNIYCKVFRGSDDTPIVQIGDPIAASTIGTSYEYVEFENTLNGYVLNVNDVVAIEFEGGDTTHRIGVHVRQNTDYDGANSHVVRYNGQEYDDMLEWDLVATMWFGGDTYQPPPFAQPDPTPTNNKALLYCAGNNLLSGFARVLQREFAIYAEDTTEEEALNKYTNRYSKTSRAAMEVLTAGLYRPF